ncbi:amidohydrolase [Paremcibacter congregatus]|uniref:amidohydrolase n=1 Tax=Paremcibacter congregatus TaxID=2043170 RepID=UPI003A914131
MKIRQIKQVFGGVVTGAAFIVCSQTSLAQDGKDWQDNLLVKMDRQGKVYDDIALRIGALAEIGHQEVQSSALLQKHLKQKGFSIAAGVAGMPTAFVASYGSGKPVIGIVAEFDALPGLSQTTDPVRTVNSHNSAGHACGHHLLGTGAIEAAVAVKDWLKKSGHKGTIRVYGAPAEEGGGGKVYLAREGHLDDVDALLNWHPWDQNASNSISTLSNYNGKFRFYGTPSHAAAAPEKGRSALDGVEAMNHMVNMMREHLSEKTRVHYVITAGGDAPNVVPKFAEVYYYARHPDPAEVKRTWAWIKKAAEGAALGTGTRVESEILNAVYPVLPNDVMSRLVHRNLTRVGGVSYTAEETKFANKVMESYALGPVSLKRAEQIQDLETGDRVLSASSDVGDLSWIAPTNWLSTATWVPGTSAHSWQAVAAGNMSIGLKGMRVASKVMALSAIELFQTPTLVAAAKAEMEKRRGPGFTYKALLGDRKPPLDYRKK